MYVCILVQYGGGVHVYVCSCTILRWSTCVRVFLYNTEVEYMRTCVLVQY